MKESSIELMEQIGTLYAHFCIELGLGELEGVRLSSNGMISGEVMIGGEKVWTPEFRHNDTYPQIMLLVVRNLCNVLELQLAKEHQND